MTDDTQWNASALPAAPLPASLKARLQAAMKTARREGRQEEEWAKQLAERLAPAPLRPPFRQRLEHQLKSRSRRLHRPAFLASLRWGSVSAAAASLALLLGIGGMLLFSFLGESDEKASEAYTSRSVIESRGGDTVHWQDGLIPVHRYEVTYEDSFVLPGDDDTTLVIRVPNRTTISVRGDII